MTSASPEISSAILLRGGDDLCICTEGWPLASPPHAGRTRGGHDARRNQESKQPNDVASAYACGVQEGEHTATQQSELEWNGGAYLPSRLSTFVALYGITGVNGNDGVFGGGHVDDYS